jgi:hypothetical protein
MSTSSEAWHELLSRWPADASRRGIIITEWNEQIPFVGFTSGTNLVCLDRSTPDAFGGRTIILPLTQIAGIKFTDVMKPQTLEAMGFSSPHAPR